MLTSTLLLSSVWQPLKARSKPSHKRELSTSGKVKPVPTDQAKSGKGKSFRLLMITCSNYLPCGVTCSALSRKTKATVTVPAKNKRDVKSSSKSHFPQKYCKLTHIDQNDHYSLQIQRTRRKLKCGGSPRKVSASSWCCHVALTNLNCSAQVSHQYRIRA